VKDLFYRLLAALARRLGNWVFLMMAWFVAAGYFLFFPRRRAVSVDFYETLFPGRGRRHALACAWRQYHAFVRVFLDRFRLAEGETIPTTCEGWEHIAAAARSSRGAVVLMSHLGGWEIAARLLQERGREVPGMRLMLYLGQKDREQIEGRQKRAVAESGIRVVAVPENAQAALEILDGLTFLREGGLVSLTGDRLWGREQRAVTVRFAGGRARIPETPFVLALASEAPLIIFFGWRTGAGGFHLVAKPPLTVAAATRAERAAAIQAAAQAYADLLAETVRAHPDQWFHFTPFLLAPEPDRVAAPAGGPPRREG